jgi:hypothetical protein
LPARADALRSVQQRHALDLGKHRHAGLQLQGLAECWVILASSRVPPACSEP